MSDYRNPDFDPYDPNDPYRRSGSTSPNLRPSNIVTGWVVAAVFVVAILAVIFGLSHQQQLGTNTASNDVVQRGASPTTTQTAPPAHATPSPLTTTKAPINPVPPTPSQSGGGQ